VRWWEVAKRTFREYGQDNGPLMAAAVAFYLLLSLVPLVLVAAAVIASVLGPDAQLREHVVVFLERFLPGSQFRSEIRDWLNDLIHSRGQVGLVGLVGLVLTAAGGFATLETAINVAWGTPHRGVIMNKVFALGMVLMIGVLFLLSFLISLALQWADRVPVIHAVASNWGMQLTGYVAPVVLTGLGLTMVYKLFPTARVPWKAALSAGFITGLAWEMLKHGYAVFTRMFGDQSATYGDALAGVAGLVLWIYYSCSVILLGGELAWVLSGCPGKGTDVHDDLRDPLPPEQPAVCN